jgi:signal transduction histidine kinase
MNVALAGVIAAGVDDPRTRAGRPRGLLETRWLRLAVWPVAIAAQLAVLWPVVFGDEAASAEAIDFAYRVTGGSFVVCGLIAWQRRPANRVGLLMVGVGFGLFVNPLLSWGSGSIVRTLGLLFADYWAILFVFLLLVFPYGRSLGGRLDWLVLLAVAVPPAFIQPVWLLFVDEGGDNSLRSGYRNLLLVWPNAQVADAIDQAQRGIGVFASVLLFSVLVWRWLKASPPLRRVLVPVLAGGAAMLSFAVLLTFDLFSRARYEVAFVTFIVLGSVPLVFLASFLHSRLARASVGDLFATLRADPAPAELRDAIARALGDPSLSLAYWLPAFESWGDLDGREVVLPNDGSRATTLIERNGRHFAALLHDPVLEEEPELLQVVCSATAIALENGRLQADQRAHLEELMGSRARVIEAGQRERQRLERNLHDGAQQRLIALSLELGLLEKQIADDTDTSTRLGQARREIAASLDELRAVARGLHPAVLSGHGLGVALRSLIATAPLPVRLTVGFEGRLPDQIEVAAYYVVSESLANIGKHARAGSVSIDVSHRDGLVVVEVADDGIGGVDPERGSGLRGLADRVEALGGRLRVWSPAGGGTRLRAEMPCA